jgi:1,4-alpha-glucan branching enzyme
MKKFYLFLAALISLGASKASAAVMETNPAPLQETSSGVVITFNALEAGVDALKGLSTDLYAHIGVTTNLSSSWTHVVTTWGTNNTANTFKRVAANTYQLTLDGTLRDYFGVTDSSETIENIAIIARTADGKTQTKDIFIPVYPQGFYMDFASSPASTAITSATSITFTAQTTEAGTIQIYLDGTKVQEATNATKLTYTKNFNEAGKQWTVKAVATKGSDVKESSINVIYVAASAQQNYPGGVPQQGAVKNSDGTVTFCLAAPNKTSVLLAGSWNDYGYTEMKYQDYNGFRYFWTTVSGLDNSKYYSYYYLVDGNYKVGDPYAKLVLDPNSDKWLSDDVFPDRPEYPYTKFDDTMLAVYKGDIDDYNWKVKDYHVGDVNALTIYEILLRDFTGTNSTADGTLAQAIKRIPYLKELGVTAVELMPIMEFDGNNSWGYNTNSYMAPDKSYGSPDEYKEFIDKCHQEGIAVILDIVLNHTPGLHPWYAMYDDGTSPFYNATAPHSYSVYNDIKQEYGLVEQHWKDVLKYWITAYKVDGFRFDLVKGLGDSSSYGTGGDSNTNADNQTRIDRMKRLHAYMKTIKSDIIHINEDLANYTEETQLGNDGQLQWNKQIDNSTAYVRGTGSANLQYFLSTNCSRPAFSTVDYAESHDEQRMGYSATQAGGNTVTNTRSTLARRAPRLASVGVNMLMFPGPKMIWQFGELGADESTKSSSGDNNTDPKKVLWNNIENTTAANYQYYKGIHDAYQAVCWLRRQFPEMFSSSATLTTSGFGNDVTNVRTIRLTNGTKEILAILNPTVASSTTLKTVSVATSYIKASNYSVVAQSFGAGAYSSTPTVTGTGTNISVQVPSSGFVVLTTAEMAAGIDDVIADSDASNVKVYGGQGQIIVQGDYNNVDVYNLAGQRLNSLNVPAGIYVVNVDGNATKVVVK